MKYALAALVVVSFTADAHAFEIFTPVSEGCHEEVTLAAAVRTGFPALAQAPAATEDQRRAMNDLVFDLPDRDPWSLALYIGVRSNDLRDNAPTDLSALFHVHDDPADQPAHCLRRPEDDGAQGDVGALAACRAFIVGELEAGGLLEDTLDLTSVEPVRSFFKFRGVYEIALPRFAYRLGRAAHTVQDAYTHTMRDADTGAVRHVLNWVDAFRGAAYAEAQDGYLHLSALDDCRRTDTHQRSRIDRSIDATTRLFAAVADPAPGRRARVIAAVDAALVLMPGCDATNRYCDAPELAESKDIRSFGCVTTPRDGALVVAALALLLVVGGRPRRRPGMAAMVLALATWSVEAHAQQPPPPRAVVPTGPESAALAVKDASDRWHTDHWHFDARAGGSIDDAGIAGMIGIGRTQGRWTAGFLAEWNPWFSYDQIAVRPGVFNAYLTLSYRWFQGNRLSIATRIEAGTSTMLFELLGLDRFTTGLYVGGALATIRIPISPCVAVTFDPIHVALPTPRPFGLPFYYKQYRVTFGLEVRL